MSAPYGLIIQFWSSTQLSHVSRTYKLKICLITPNPMRELERTVGLFDELIGAGIYMLRWGEYINELSIIMS